MSDQEIEPKGRIERFRVYGDSPHAPQDAILALTILHGSYRKDQVALMIDHDLLRQMADVIRQYLEDLD